MWTPFRLCFFIFHGNRDVWSLNCCKPGIPNIVVKVANIFEKRARTCWSIKRLKIKTQLHFEASFGDILCFNCNFSLNLVQNWKLHKLSKNNLHIFSFHGSTSARLMYSLVFIWKLHKLSKTIYNLADELFTSGNSREVFYSVFEIIP